MKAGRPEAITHVTLTDGRDAVLILPYHLEKLRCNTKLRQLITDGNGDKSVLIENPGGCIIIEHVRAHLHDPIKRNTLYVNANRATMVIVTESPTQPTHTLFPKLPTS